MASTAYVQQYNQKRESGYLTRERAWTQRLSQPIMRTHTLRARYSLAVVTQSQVRVAGYRPLCDKDRVCTVSNQKNTHGRERVDRPTPLLAVTRARPTISSARTGEGVPTNNTIS